LICSVVSYYLTCNYEYVSLLISVWDKLGT